ncbi:hypothetical protein IFM89_018530 [Coptis chinensis]|uniref:Uncharacterized protein n=1 Tax=Coptis chinensis TaxID=261450 RepID=A0A835HYR0_9MAGN|nr:hypothetical protein IFM89_018530 [Coptis chinensis]
MRIVAEGDLILEFPLNLDSGPSLVLSSKLLPSVSFDHLKRNAEISLMRTSSYATMRGFSPITTPMKQVAYNCGHVGRKMSSHTYDVVSRLPSKSHRFSIRVEEVKQLHEDGELAKLVQDFPVQEPGFVCGNCGDARFVPCSSCSGSRKAKWTSGVYDVVVQWIVVVAAAAGGDDGSSASTPGAAALVIRFLASTGRGISPSSSGSKDKPSAR